MKKVLQCLGVIIVFLFCMISCNNLGAEDESSEEFIFTGLETERNQDDQFLQSLRELESEQGRGSLVFESLDHEMEGSYWNVKENGVVVEISLDEAINLAKQYGWVDTNGSGNTLEAAKRSALKKVQKVHNNAVLVYLAQGYDYWSAEDSAFKAAYAILVNRATESGHSIRVTSHSWSGHLVSRIVRNNAFVTHFAFNPAHGNLKLGEKIADFVEDLRYTHAKTVILTGADDSITTYGGGSSYKSSYFGITGYNSVYYAIESNSKVELILIPHAGHGISSMLENGAMAFFH